MSYELPHPQSTSSDKLISFSGKQVARSEHFDRLMDEAHLFAADAASVNSCIQRTEQVDLIITSRAPLQPLESLDQIPLHGNVGSLDNFAWRLGLIMVTPNCQKAPDTAAHGPLHTSETLGLLKHAAFLDSADEVRSYIEENGYTSHAWLDQSFLTGQFLKRMWTVFPELTEALIVSASTRDEYKPQNVELLRKAYSICALFVDESDQDYRASFKPNATQNPWYLLS